jgi:hypothetical protein
MAVDVYLQIDGIKGEPMDSGHQGWIEVTSAQFNDNRIPGVKPWPKHNDHFHVEVKLGKK